MGEIGERGLLVLAGLAHGPRHGYGLVDEIAEITNGRTRPLAGTLYRTLERLQEDGLVTVRGEAVVEGRLRRYYELTGDGRLALGNEARRVKRIATIALRRLEGTE